MQANRPFGAALCASLLFSAFLASAAVAAAAPPAEAPPAEELLERSIVYHDPEGSFLASAHRLTFKETRPGGPDRRTEVEIDPAADRFAFIRHAEHETTGTWSRGQCTATLDGRSVLSDAERAEHRLSCDQIARMRNYYFYLWGLPMKLRDPGTRLGAVTETEFDDRSVFGLRVTYDRAVGSDVWYLYFDPETFALAGYRFYHDEAKGDGEYILLRGEARLGALRLPKERTWYTHQGDRLLGTDRLISIETAEGGDS